MDIGDTATQTSQGDDLGFRPAAAKVRVPPTPAPASDDLGFRPAATPGDDLGFRPATPPAAKTQQIKPFDTSELATPSATALSPGIAPDLEQPYHAVPGLFGEPMLTEESKQRLAANRINRGQITAGKPGVGGWLQSLEGDIRHGTGATAPGRVLQAMGAQGTESGVSPAVAETVGGPFIGPVRAVAGLKQALGPYAGEAADVTSELHGLNEAVRGVMQTAAPVLITQPEALAALPAYGIGGELAQRGLEKAGVSPEMAELASNAALLGGGLLHGFIGEPKPEFGTLDRTKAVAPARPEAKPLLRLPAGPDTKALPPSPSEAIERAANVYIAPGEKPISLPAQTPTRIGPGAEPIAVGPSSAAAELGFRPSRKTSAETPAAKSEPSLNELRGQLVALDTRYSALNKKLETTRTYETSKAVIDKLRTVSEQRKDLRARIEEIAPRPEAQPFKHPEPGQPVEAAAPKTVQREPIAATKKASGALPTPNWDSLAPEQQTEVKAWMQSHEHEPSLGQKATEQELRKYSPALTPMKEQFARAYANGNGLPIVRGENEPISAMGFVNKSEATPLSRSADARPFEKSTVRQLADGTTVKTGSAENGETISAGEKALVDSGKLRQDEIGRFRSRVIDEWESEGRPGNLFEDYYAQALRKITATEIAAPVPPGPGITRLRSAEAREQRITGGKNATPTDMMRTLEEDNRQLEIKIRGTAPGLERHLAEGRLKQGREMLEDLRAGKIPPVEQRAAGPSSPEQLAGDAGLVYKGEAVKGTGVHQFEHPEYPGATMAVRERDLATPEALEARMQTKLAEKPIVPKPGETASSVEFMRALSDRKPEAGVATPEMLRDLFSGKLPKEAWKQFVADPIIEKGLGIGDKYAKVREADPDVAGGLHLLDNAPAYFRAKAAQNVHDIIGGLSREQERLFSLMADADSRENLRTNHPNEYRSATSDPAIQEALAKYKPVEQELTAARKRVGGATLDQDYLRRVYEEHVSGIGKESAPGSSERAATAFDRVVRPQKLGNMSREATAEYHYEHGLHEFGPSFGTKFIGTHLAALRDQIARDFISKATEIAPGAAEPRSITYEGQKYFRPDIAKEMRDGGAKNVKAYDRYDPTAGVKYPEKTASKFLGPQEVVRALNDYGARRDTGRGPVGRFLQEQTIGFGLGIPHVANILRRVTQSAPLGAANPEAWARAWKVAFGKELRTRGLGGVDDPTFDKLLQHGAITTGEMANLKSYWGGNFNPANWAKTLAGVGHKLIFEQGSFGGVGGIDQRARIYIADLLKSQKPKMSDAEIAKAVNTQLGDYNRQNWNDRQKLLSKFMLFPGWDASSIRWVIEHPIKTTAPPALLIWTANQILHHFGKNRDEDASDISNVHFGDRSIGVSLLRESMGRNLTRPILNLAQSKIRGESTERAIAEASRGVAQGAGGAVGTLRPDITAAIDLAMNRSSPFGGKELVSPDDYKEPGRVLPNRALEKQAALVVRHAIPALDRMLGSDQEIDFKSFAGSNLGLPNYQDGAEQRLKRNIAESLEVSTTIGHLAKTKPEAARQFVQDPDNAAYALFHHELGSMAATLKRIDEAKDAVDSAKNLSSAEKSERLANIAKARENLLRNADGLDALLFKRKQQGREKPLAPTLTKRPVVETYLGR